MIGRIRAMGAGSSSGFIRAENGQSVHFDSSKVLAYDVACLAVGQMVSFDLKDGALPEAVNVCVQRSRTVAPPAETSRVEDTFRYTGFHQEGAARAYPL